MTEKKLDFSDTEVAYRDKADFEIYKRYLLLSALKSSFLATQSPKLLGFALKVKIPVRALIKKTFFELFCGGESITESRKIIDTLKQRKVGTILDFAMESGRDQNSFLRAKDETIANIRFAKASRHIPFCVLKFTAICDQAILNAISSGKNVQAATSSYDCFF